MLFVDGRPAGQARGRFVLTGFGPDIVLGGGPSQPADAAIDDLRIYSDPIPTTKIQAVMRAADWTPLAWPFATPSRPSELERALRALAITLAALAGLVVLAFAIGLRRGRKPRVSRPWRW
jgi:hypothetical protein